MADSEILEGWPGHPDPETIGGGGGGSFGPV